MVIITPEHHALMLRHQASYKVYMDFYNVLKSTTDPEITRILLKCFSEFVALNIVRNKEESDSLEKLERFWTDDKPTPVNGNS